MDTNAPAGPALTGRRGARRRALLALLALAAIGARAADGPSWRELMDRAEAADAVNDEETAIARSREALDAALKTLPPHAPEIGHIYSRLVLFSLPTADAARMAEFEKRLSEFPDKDYDVWTGLGATYRSERKFEQSIAPFRNALALKPDDADDIYRLSKTYDDLQRYPEELPLLERAVALKPDDYRLQFHLAELYDRLGRPKDAKSVFARAQKMPKKALEAYIDEGYFFVKTKEDERAQREFEAAVAVDTMNALGYHHLGAFLSRKGRDAEAEPYFRKALALLRAQPDPDINDVLHAMRWLGGVLAKLKRYDEAEALFLEGIRKASENGLAGGDRQLTLMEGLADLYAVQGKNEQALAVYRRAADACTSSRQCSADYVAHVLIDLGRYELAHGMRAEAAAVAGRLEEIAARPMSDDDLYEVLEWISYYNGDIGQAERNEAIYARLQPARKALPYDFRLVWVEKGMAAAAESRGRLDEAEAHDRAALDILRHDDYKGREADALDEFARLLDKEGKPQEAVKARAESSRLRAGLANPERP